MYTKDSRDLKDDPAWFLSFTNEEAEACDKMFCLCLISSIGRLKSKFPSNLSSSRYKKDHPSRRGWGGREFLRSS